LKQSRKEPESLKIIHKQLNADIDKKFHDIIGVSDRMRRVFSTRQNCSKRKSFGSL